MGFSGSGNHHPVNVLSGKDVVEGKTGVHLGILFLETGKDCLVLVADELQGAELVVIANKILAPVAGADDGDACLISHM